MPDFPLSDRKSEEAQVSDEPGHGTSFKLPSDDPPSDTYMSPNEGGELEQIQGDARSEQSHKQEISHKEDGAEDEEE